MRTRTWLTTPPDQAPVTDERSADGERYVPGPGLVHEPRVPSRHRRAIVLVTGLAAVVVLVGLLVLGEQAQREDPSIPDVPDGGHEGERPDQLELPES